MALKLLKAPLNNIKARTSKFVFILLLMGSPCLIYGQDSGLGNWLIYLGNWKMKPQLNWHHEIQYRNYNVIGDLEQLLIRTGIGYDLTPKNNNVLLGYGYILSQNYIPGSDDKVDTSENRIFQQFIHRNKIGIVGMQHRFRFEERFVSNNSGQNDFLFRVRYFLSLNIPLNNKEMLDNTFYLSIYDEIFLNTQDDIFDRNRLYAGLGYKFSKISRIELGYMVQFFSEGSRDQINIIAHVNF